MKHEPKTLILLALLLALLAFLVLAPEHQWLAAGVGWIKTHHHLAWGAFIGAYALSCVLIIPGSLLTLSAGFVFGLPTGIALVSAGSAVGAACAFLLARFFARDWIAARISHLPRFKALDSAVRHEGFVIVFLARLSPLFPFNLLNYGLGLTAVRFRDFLLATWIGILPSIAVSVYVGSLAQNLDTLAAGFKGGFGMNALLALTLAATAALSVLITRKAKRMLALHMAKANEQAA